ncbi:putative transcription factor interactor and regulator FHA-SMAD family [Lupinus albus]|uniref:Putative transcription factor interactor and regulator FHA-SMAD family n=1 Tax=Lupinus albus TaxID=3870 RepID=A0A6A4NCC6_LUPAL|nr:putative transcription factor interactor and regulator FHA-SMAD family [Lupinus albus]
MILLMFLKITKTFSSLGATLNGTSCLRILASADFISTYDPNPLHHFFSLIDLSSAHGTLVSEMKVDPGVSVGMKEGDTLRIGASSRVYRLHWIPISRAYHLENPFVSELDVILEPQNEEELVQNLNCYPDEMEEIPSGDSILECVKIVIL